MKLLSALMLSLFTSYTYASSCSFSSGSASFDLSGLAAATDYSLAPSDGSSGTFYMQPCSDVRNKKDCDKPAAVIYEMVEGYLCRELGASASPKWALIDSGNPGKGVKVTYTNGETCYYPGGQKPYSATINYQCSPGAGVGKPTSESYDQQCGYTFNWPTSHACPGSADGAGALSSGWIFVIILLVSAFVYLIGGIAYNKKVKGIESWAESIPNTDFWKDLPSLVKDGCSFSIRLTRNLMARCGLGKEAESTSGDTPYS